MRPPVRPSLRPLAGRAVVAAVTYAISVFMLLPTLIIIPMSFGPDRFIRFPPAGFSLQWYRQYFADGEWIGATVFSVQIAVVSMIAATVIGTMLALALVRGRLPGRSVIELLIIGPVIVPQVALAVAILLVFDRLKLTGTLLGFALAHTLLALPFVVFTILASLYRFDPEMERAARTCGAGPLRAFRYVTLPMIAPGILSAALFAFVISFDEAVVSNFISNFDRKTLPRKLFEDIDFNLTPVLAAVATMLTLLAIVILLGSYFITRYLDRRSPSTRRT